MARNLRWWSWGVALLALAPWARADEPAARSLRPAAAWKVGDVLTRGEEVKVEMTDHTGGRGYEAGGNAVATVVNATWLERCESVDAQGARTAYRAYVKEFTRTEKHKAWQEKEVEAKDTSLVGRTVSVKGAGKERAYTLEGEPQKVSDGAHQWLESCFGPGERDTPERTLLPADPVKAGAAWKPDFPALGEAAFGMAGILDPAKGEGTVTLKSLDAQQAAIAWDLTAPWPIMPVPGNRPWSQGGVWHFTGDANLSSDGRVGAAESHWSIAVEGQGVIRPEDKDHGALTYSIQLTTAMHRTRTLGGTLPDSPPPR